MCLSSRVTQLVGCLQVKVPRVLRIPRPGPLSSIAYPAPGLPLKVKGILGIPSQVLPTLITLIGRPRSIPVWGTTFLWVQPPVLRATESSVHREWDPNTASLQELGRMQIVPVGQQAWKNKCGLVPARPGWPHYCPGPWELS